MGSSKNPFLDYWDNLERQQTSPRAQQKTSPRTSLMASRLIVSSHRGDILVRYSTLATARGFAARGNNVPRCPPPPGHHTLDDVIS